MRISIHDFILILSGIIYGVYEIWGNAAHGAITKVVGGLSLVLSIWMLLSCIMSSKDRTGQ